MWDRLRGVPYRRCPLANPTAQVINAMEQPHNLGDKTILAVALSGTILDTLERVVEYIRPFIDLLLGALP